MPVVGANVVVKGTRIGASTTVEMENSLNNVPRQREHYHHFYRL